MAVDKSRNPYYDDFNESKKYHEILFVPSRAVQVRELNQIQSMFYNQIERFGRHVFKEGSVVIPGEFNADFNLNYITVNLNNPFNTNSVLSDTTSEVKIVGANTGIEAFKKLYASPTDTDLPTIYFEYGKGTADQSSSTFSINDNVDLYVGNDLIDSGIIQGVGEGSKLTINNGVYFIDGRFVLFEKETTILDKYSSEPSVVVCIEYEESVITENEDNSLFDNAQGTPNFSAPGAHRLAVDTRLRVFPYSEKNNIPKNCIEIYRVINGLVQSKVTDTEYNVVQDNLARRTYEESGNYSVEDFNLIPREYQDIYGTVDDTKVGIEIGSGIAYVEGYRIENDSKLDYSINKARTTEIINNTASSFDYGNYIVVENLSSIPMYTDMQELSFYDGAASTPGAVPAGTVLGTAKVKFVRKFGASQYRLYLFDVKDASGQVTSAFVNSALSVYSSIAPSFSANIVASVDGSNLYDSGNNSMLLPLGVPVVKTIQDEVNDNDTSFTYTQMYTKTIDSNGLVTVTAPQNSEFINQDSIYAIGCFTGTTTVFDIDDFTYTLGGNPVGSVITIDFGTVESGNEVRFALVIVKRESVIKTKTLQTVTITGTTTNSILSLDKADAYNIVSITDGNGSDVTELFRLNKNIKPSYYGISFIKATDTSYVDPITVQYQYFQHSTGDFFSVDSYVDLAFVDMPTEDGFGRISDYLDFRPKIADNGTNFTGSGSSISSTPLPLSVVRSDVEYYLSRMDKISLTNQGEFVTTEGIPSVNPDAPSSPESSMTLFDVFVPAYTFSPYDVRIDKVDNTRYTMKDIGRIDQRLSNVEYYVALNNLEQETLNKQIIDPTTGTNRFKNGFITDTFSDHNVGDYTWDNYRCSVGGETLSPQVSVNVIDLELDELNSSNYMVNNSVLSLPYTEISFIDQPLRTSTINVNPYAVFVWNGNVKLTPQVDTWFDTEYKAPINISAEPNIEDIAQSKSSWDGDWFTQSSQEFKALVDRGHVDSNMNITRHRPGRYDYPGLTYERKTITKDSSVKTLNSKTATYMRSIKVKIDGSGNRPNTKMYFFFDNTPITQYVGPDASTIGNDVVTDGFGNFSAVFKIPTGKFTTGEKSVKVSDVNSPNSEDADNFGSALFSSSGTVVTKQKTQKTVSFYKKKMLPMKKRPAWMRRRDEEDNSGGGVKIYAGYGNSIADGVSINSDEGGDLLNKYMDPIAQSFLVEREGGICLTSIDLFLATKDQRVPLKVQIREMENGTPSKSVVPGADVLLHPDDINISSDGSIPTNFKFDYPIYLNSGTEYCFVMLPNSDQYEAFIAETGFTDLNNGGTVTKQPYTGSMFKSQNNSTWTPEQNSDIQFQLYCAKFDTSVVGNVQMTNPVDEEFIPLDKDPIVPTAIGSTVVRIKRRNHNFITGTFVKIEGVVGANGVSDAEINAQHVVTNVIDPNTFEIDIVGLNPTAKIRFGGTEGVISKTIQASVLRPNISEITFPNTKVSMFYKGISGKSFGGNEIPYDEQLAFTKMKNNTINSLKAPLLITNQDDEVQNNVNGRSFYSKFELSTTNQNVSPLIDISNANIVAPYSIIDVEGTHQDFDDNWFNYRTKISGLEFPASGLDIYLDVKRSDNSGYKVYTKVGNSIEDVEQSDWVEVQPTNYKFSDGTFVENFFEHEFDSEFKFYQVAIVAYSDSCVNVPEFKRLRAIAVA